MPWVIEGTISWEDRKRLEAWLDAYDLALETERGAWARIKELASELRVTVCKV